MGAKADRKKIGWPGKTAGGIIAGLLLGAPGTEAWAEPAEDSISVSHDVNFDVNNMWDDDDDVWNLNLATDEVPEEGISFAMDVLIPVSEGEEPSFEGRIRVQTALLLGESEEWAQSNAVTEYDFTTSSARNQSDDSVRQILPGGACNEKFNAYLDMIADYAGQVKGPILFRPFHEAAGGWFWWGASGGSTAEYQQLFQYTAEYLWDTKQVHNLIYVYTADVEYTQDSAAVSDQRYPGDDYVDVIGIDIYDANSEAGSGPWFSEFAAGVSAARQFADEHGKLFAVTETGIMQMVPEKGDAVIALRRSGNPETHWFGKMLDVLSGSEACYVLTWSNSTELFHVPYVKAVHRDGSLYGHEMIDGFMEFFNDRRSVFAVNQRWILKDFQ